MAAILIPILSQLAAKGLDLIGSAVMAKGTQVVQDTLGVNLDQELQTPEGVQKLQQMQIDHEEELLKLSLQDKQLDLSFYQTDASDRANARTREVEIMQAEHVGWLNAHMASILALIIILGGGFFLYFSVEADIKYAVVSLMTAVITYYFGSSKSSSSKDATINSLSKG